MGRVWTTLTQMSGVAWREVSEVMVVVFWAEEPDVGEVLPSRQGNHWQKKP